MSEKEYSERVAVTEGRGAGFSLKTLLGLRFVTVSRLFTDEELENLRPVEAG